MIKGHYRVFSWAGLGCAIFTTFLLIGSGAAPLTAVTLALPPAAAAIAVLTGSKRQVCFAAGALFLLFPFLFGIRLNSPNVELQLLFPPFYSTFPGFWLGGALIAYSLKKRLPYAGWFTLFITAAILTDLLVSFVSGKVDSETARCFFFVYSAVFPAQAADVLLAFAVQGMPGPAAKSELRKP